MTTMTSSPVYATAGDTMVAIIAVLRASPNGRAPANRVRVLAPDVLARMGRASDPAPWGAAVRHLRGHGFIRESDDDAGVTVWSLDDAVDMFLEDVGEDWRAAAEAAVGVTT